LSTAEQGQGQLAGAERQDQGQERQGQEQENRSRSRKDRRQEHETPVLLPAAPAPVTYSPLWVVAGALPLPSMYGCSSPTNPSVFLMLLNTMMIASLGKPDSSVNV